MSPFDLHLNSLESWEIKEISCEFFFLWDKIRLAVFCAGNASVSIDANILVCICEHKNRVCMCVGVFVIDRQGDRGSNGVCVPSP